MTLLQCFVCCSSPSFQLWR